MDEPKTPFNESKTVKKVLKVLKDTRDKLKDTFSNIDIKNINNQVKEKYENIDIKDLKNTYKSNSNVRKALAGFMVMVMIGLGYTGYKINEINTRAFDVYIGDKVLGSIRTQDEAIEVFDEVRLNLCEKYDLDVVLDNELTFKPTHAKDSDLITLESLKADIKSNIGFLVAGFGVNVDGKEIGVFASEEEVNNLMQMIKEPYISKFTEEDNSVEVNFVEDVQVVKKQVSMNALSDKEKVLDYIRDGGEKIRTHIIEAGESFWTIAKIYDTSVDDLVLANSDKDPAKLKPGDEIKLVLPTSLITVETIAEVEYNEQIAFDTKVELNDSMYKNEQKIKVEGIKGESKVVAKEIRHNGVVVDKEIINEQVLKEATDQIVVKGTKEVPKTAATGAFLMPTRGRISSRYGSRWGRVHKGLDIAASQGTAIKAADGGTVSFSGYKGSYGYMIEIDHGNGYKTRYAHCSKLLVKKGAKVAKGQHIANVGNTGRSTGTHLHFEVLKNGVNQNPSNYVK